MAHKAVWFVQHILPYINFFWIVALFLVGNLRTHNARSLGRYEAIRYMSQEHMIGVNTMSRAVLWATAKDHVKWWRRWFYASR